jgi:group I intron endonuclease
MSKPYGHIYKVTNVVTGKSYIGQTTTSIRRRWQGHCSKTTNSVLHKAIKKYGKEAFQVEMLDAGVDKWDLDQLEIHYIKTLNTMSPRGYNLKEGGASGKLSEESLKKMAESLKGKPSWNKGKKTGKPSWNKGKKASEEARKNQSLAHLGKPASNRRPIIDSNGIIYESLQQAAEKLGSSSHANISAVLSGRRKTATGLSFSYLDTQQTNIA